MWVRFQSLAQTGILKGPLAARRGARRSWKTNATLKHKRLSFAYLFLRLSYRYLDRQRVKEGDKPLLSDTEIACPYCSYQFPGHTPFSVPCSVSYSGPCLDARPRTIAGPGALVMRSIQYPADMCLEQFLMFRSWYLVPCAVTNFTIGYRK